MCSGNFGRTISSVEQIKFHSPFNGHTADGCADESGATDKKYFHLELVKVWIKLEKMGMNVNVKVEIPKQICLSVEADGKEYH